ncbi:MFS transporter [Kocuria tytonicola]|uniref:MFS transporter n=1 Tax=Kocuria tytonicola TaxID=2055946 RepID=UPI0014022497|nr:MFS transporter [Kocuria tytonicola]
MGDPLAAPAPQRPLVTPPRTPRDASLAVLLVGLLVSACGDDVAAIAFSLRAAKSGAPHLLAAILLAQTVPAVGLGLFGGVLVDRVLRWWWWPVSLAAQAALFLVMAVTRQDAVIVVCVAAVSAVSALTAPVANKLIAVRSRDHRRVSGHLATVNGLSQACGAALGGIAFGVGGIAPLLCVNAATFALLAVIAVCVTGRAPLPVDASPGGGALLGLRRLLHPAAFGAAGVALLTCTVFATSVEGVSGVFVLTHHAGWDPAWVGAAWGLWGLGVVLGGQAAGRVPRWSAPVVLVTGAGGMGAVFLVLALGLPGFGLGALLFLLGGAANGVFNAAASRTLLTGVSTQEQGRAWAAYRWIVTCCLVGGFLTGGALGEHDAVAALLLAGGLAVSGALVRGVALVGTRPTDAAAPRSVVD